MGETFKINLFEEAFDSDCLYLADSVRLEIVDKPKLSILQRVRNVLGFKYTWTYTVRIHEKA